MSQMIALSTLLKDMVPAVPKATGELAHELYTRGMHFADALRRAGRTEEAHDTEVWVLSLCDQMVKDQRTIEEHTRATHASDLEDFDGRS
jgi:hypothetical protein